MDWKKKAYGHLQYGAWECGAWEIIPIHLEPFATQKRWQLFHNGEPLGHYWRLYDAKEHAQLMSLKHDRV